MQTRLKCSKIRKAAAVYTVHTQENILTLVMRAAKSQMPFSMTFL